MNDDTIESLWREHYPRVVRTAYLLTGNMEDAQELAQDAFVAAITRWKDRPLDEYAEAWLHRVVRNRAISLFRRRRRREQEAHLSVGTSVHPEDPLDPGLVRAIAKLPPAQRAAFVCRYYLDCSIEEASRVLGKRPGTVRALTTQAVARLRQEVAGLDATEKGEEDAELRHRSG